MTQEIPPAENTPPAAESVKTVETVTADILVAEMGSKMPPVTEGLTDSVPSPEIKKDAPNPEARVYRDARGNKFNPIYDQHVNGVPVMNDKGNFKRWPDRIIKENQGKAPLGGKPFSAQVSAPTFNAPGSQVASSLPVLDEYDHQAEVYLQASYGPLIIAFTEEIRPDQEEHSGLKQSLAAWLRFKQVTELSPGWAFGLCAVAVFAKKTSKPTVRERLTLYYLKAKNWFSGMIGKNKEKSP